MATAVETDNLLKDAALVVDVCMSVEEGDVVTIICDDEHTKHAAAVAEVVVERGGWPVVMNNETQVRRGRADVRFPMAPPANLHRANGRTASRTSMPFARPARRTGRSRRSSPEWARGT